MLYCKSTLWFFSRWLVEQGLTSHLTQFRSFRRRYFYRSDDPTISIKALKEGGYSYPDSSQSHQAHLTMLQSVKYFITSWGFGIKCRLNINSKCTLSLVGSVKRFDCVTWQISVCAGSALSFQIMRDILVVNQQQMTSSNIYWYHENRRHILDWIYLHRNLTIVSIQHERNNKTLKHIH